VFRNEVHRRNYQKLLVALYLAADDDDRTGEGEPYSRATNVWIARLAGLKAPTVTAYLRDFEAYGHIKTYMPAEFAINGRIIVLKDHPGAKSFIREMLEMYGPGRSKLAARQGKAT
jgi:DNA-binding MarR family transcriptional regulator